MDEAVTDKHREGDCNMQVTSVCQQTQGTVLEKVVAIRELNEVNVRLTLDLTQSQRVSNVWMITACVITIMVEVSGWVYLA